MQYTGISKNKEFITLAEFLNISILLVNILKQSGCKDLLLSSNTFCKHIISRKRKRKIVF